MPSSGVVEDEGYRGDMIGMRGVDGKEARRRWRRTEKRGRGRERRLVSAEAVPLLAPTSSIHTTPEKGEDKL